MNPIPDASNAWNDSEKIRQLFDQEPYPRIPLDGFPHNDYERFFIHSLVTAHYLRHRKVIEPTNRVILDAGCGSGYKSLVLAVANPGARVVGVDLSEQSANLARQRLAYHSIDNTEFHALSIYDIAQLGMEFDYINCDDVLYLLPDPAAALKAMKSVLKPDGLIRANLHSIYQRTDFYRAQALCRYLGLMDEIPADFEFEAVIETMKALKDVVKLKAETWNKAWESQSKDEELEKIKETLSANFLLLGDKGYTILDLFAMLDQSDLEFISMVNWRHWDVTDLFQQPDDLPVLWGLALAEASPRDKLRLFELLHPIHRLLDFWCGHPGTPGVSVDDWSESDWQTATVHLHPYLRVETLKEDLISCLQKERPFEISQSIKLPVLSPVMLEPNLATCLLPLWEGPQPIQVLANRYQQVRSVDPVTLEPTTAEAAWTVVKNLLNRLDAFLYVLLERA